MGEIGLWEINKINEGQRKKLLFGDEFERTEKNKHQAIRFNADPHLFILNKNSI